MLLSYGFDLHDFEGLTRSVLPVNPSKYQAYNPLTEIWRAAFIRSIQAHLSP
jgi:hypothetical protein